MLARPKIRARVLPDDAAAFVALLRRAAIVIEDPGDPPRLTPDPGDDFIVALARAGRCEVIVSGDSHLTEAELENPRVMTPRDFLSALSGESERG